MNPFLRHVLVTVPLLAAGLAPAHAADATLLEALSKLAPHANAQVIGLALAATECATSQGQPPADRLAVIDYSLPSTKPRMWVFDLTTRKLLFHELVAHGRNTGENFAKKFSNQAGSLESSLGLFRTRDTYAGRNGDSLRMDGLEPGVNDRARERALVIHGASYVSAAAASQQGRIGRSWGCPAVRSAVARPLIDTLKSGQYVFSFYPDQHWLATSPFLKCRAARTMVAATAAR
jgi:hypothetical protein